MPAKDGIRSMRIVRSYALDSRLRGNDKEVADMSAPLFGIPQKNAHDFLPSRDANLLAWSSNFRDQINSPPGPAQFGLTLAQAAEYSSLHDAYKAAYVAARNARTNSQSNVQAKNDAKAALKADARLLARIIRAHPDVTNEQRIQLGLKAADLSGGTPVTVSDDKPMLMLTSTADRIVRLKIRSNATTTRRARPHGMVGALILSCVAGPQDEVSPPESIWKWSYCGHAMRSKFQVAVPSDVPAGAKVWFIACWVNTRGRTGPFSSAVSTRIGDGVGNFAGALRLAA
jgi:hypothetical protein